jgi:hypothetical protein
LALFRPAKQSRRRYLIASGDQPINRSTAFPMRKQE